MLHRSSIRSVLSIAAIFWLAFSYCAFAEDSLPMSGECLSDQEMSETRGGFVLPGGDLLYFSMDLMKLNFVAENAPDSGNLTAWMSSLNSRITVSETGAVEVCFGAQQGGVSVGGAQVLGATVGLNASYINDSFKDFCGIANGNIITGNGNVAFSPLILNMRVAFINSNNLNANHIQDLLF